MRHQTGLSLLDVEELSDGEIREGALGTYERGERAITVARVHLLAKIYDVPVDQLLPPADTCPTRWRTDDTQVGAGFSHPSPMTRPQRVTIDLIRLREKVGPERDVLRRFLDMILLQRQDFNGRMITIRTGDLRVIACLFGIAADETGQRLDDLGLLVRPRVDSL